MLHRVDQALDVDPATGEVEGDEEGFPEEYPLEQLNIATADFMAKVSGQRSVDRTIDHDLDLTVG